jgi:hypothetical protein
MMLLEDQRQKYDSKGTLLGHKSHQLLRDFFSTPLKNHTIIVTYYTFLGSKK